ncbi:MAG TPA: polysaccharide biosynthesis tyrosine autokinase [Azospirillum sp.]|nr:polysaccharide biosynthesis tyrosine autokinase [Azospirillum sp.]
MERARNNSDNDDASLDLRAVIGGLRRRKWTIIGTVVVGIAASVSLTFLIPPRYTATSVVMIERRDTPISREAKANADVTQKDELYVANQAKVLEARSSLQQVIERMGLRTDPEFNPGPGIFGQPAILPAMEWLQRTWPSAADRLGWSSAAAAEPGDPSQSTGAGVTEEMYERFTKKLSVVHTAQSSMVSVSFTSRDPVKAAQIANTVVETYVQTQKEERSAEHRRTNQWLSGTVERLRLELSEAEKAAHAYKAANNLRNTPDGTFGVQQVLSLQADLHVATAERAAKEAKLRHVYELRAKGDGYRPLTEITSSSLIAVLLQRDDELLREAASLSMAYGDKHPLVQKAKVEREGLARKMDREVRDIVRNMEGDVAIAQARERALADILKAAETESVRAGQAEVWLHQIQRDLASKRSVHDDMMVRLTRIQDEASLVESDARVISVAAVPNRPAFPKLGVMGSVGFIGALVFGVGLAALREHFDRGLRTGRQVEEALGLANLGLVPKIHNGFGRSQAPYKYLLDRPSSAYAEAIRSILTRLHLSDAETPPHVVLVTSSLPGEGKTTLAMSLAASAARSGLRTAVVDLDLRHPTVVRELGHPIEAGLLEVLSGEWNLDDIIQEDPEEPNLHVIPVKGRSGRAADILGSPMVKSLLDELRRRYDYIVLDTPPALGFSDANVIALMSDAVVFVVQWEKTNEDLAATALEALLKGRAPVIGAAVTQVNVRRHLQYGYSDVCESYGRHQKYFAN